MKYMSMRFAVIALLVAFCLLSATGVVFGDESSPANPQPVDPEALARLTEETGADVQLAAQTGAARFVRWTGANAQRISARLGTGGAVEARADAFFRSYGGAFGIRDAAAELVLTKKFTDNLATEHLVYAQVYQGLPVFGGNIRVHFDGRGALTAVNGIFIPKIALNPKPVLTENAARQIGIGHVSRSLALDGENPRQMSLNLSSTNARLIVFRAYLAQGLVGSNHLVYEVEVVGGAALREFVYVDAHTGGVVEQIAGIHEELSRRVYDGGYDPFLQVWQEEDGPYLGNDKDIQNIIDFSKDTYDLFVNLSGGSYRSYDGRDARMETVNNDSNISCPNAYWNGISTNYCTGVTGDDTVAHEWGHAYTEKTHNLIYAWQPGALNESYSDIIGEIVDFINGAGLDNPGSPRTAAACSLFQPSFPASVQVNTPPAIAGIYEAGSASFGPALTTAGITGDLVLGNDGNTSGTGGTETDGCQPLVNTSALAGKIAVIDLGVCNFTVKVKNAQNAGAIAAIIVNPAADGDAVFNMPGIDASITIPSVLIGKTAGGGIKANLPGVNATLRLNPGPVAPDSSYRWLSGEDDPAFGGAIRDLWTPNCFGHPGKVSDTHYHCAVSDGGGVHSNSGIPNHGFALLVDGGTYNGQSIQPLGLTKAAHIYWRTMTTYQHQASDFTDHADSLQAACSDLVGQNLLSLTTGQPSGEIISSADCAQVDKVISAIELRTAPTQCNFQPLLTGNAPALCAAPGGAATTVFFANFESQPQDWQLSNVGVYSEYRPSDWAWITDLPSGRGGSAFFAVNGLDVGTCGTDDQSGVKYLESPAITLPIDIPFARLSFDHYVATETQWDGGNLWIQVNEGDWQLVEEDDFEFNPYNTFLADSSNPLAGMPAFSGSNQGGLSGSWGQSQVDLSAYAQRGDTVKLRFALGVDGCFGINGWYVDDVRLYYCPAEAGPTASLRLPDGASALTKTLLGVVAGTQTFSITNSGLTHLNWSVGEDTDAVAAHSVPDLLSRPLSRTPNPQFSGVVRRPQMADSKNVVQDGSFEAGTPNPFWAESAITFAPPLCSPALCGYDLAQDGRWYAWFGGWGDLHQSALTQTVTISTSGIAQLSFWVLTNFVRVGDEVVVSLDGAPLFVVDSQNAADFSAGYVQVKLNVSSYADGGQHILALTGSTVGNILIDNVILRDEPPLCAIQEDVPWLSVTPATGSLAVGQSADLTVAFNADGLNGVLHEAALCITTNDKRAPLITLPVYLTVQPDFLWNQSVFVNGVEYADTNLITGIDASDTITIVDRVVVTSTGTVSFSLRYGWTEFLALQGTQTLQSGSNSPAGTISSIREGIDEWLIESGTSKTVYTIVRTFGMQPGTKTVNRVSERLSVQGVPYQLPQISFTFQPTLHLYFPSVGR